MLGMGLFIPPLIAELEALCRWAEHQASLLEGKKAAWLDWFVVLVAGAFEAAGGTPSASQESIPREDGKRHRNTRFLRVLFYIHERLPAARRAPSEAALGERARRVLSTIKRWKEQSTGKVNRGKRRR
jgi:hypothetical protein